MFTNRKKQRTVESVPVSAVLPNPFQPRRDFDEEELFSLSKSIKENGLIQPIAVRRAGKGFELIAGERRLRAVKMLGEERIDAVVYDLSNEDSAVWALIENLERAQLSPFDEAEAIAKLIAVWNLPREEAAKRLGFSPSGLSNKLRLLKLEEEVRKVITENALSERHARELLRLSSGEERKAAAEHFAAKGLSVAAAEKYVSAILEKKPKRKAPKYLIKDVRIFLNTFEHAVAVMNSAGLCAVSTVTEDDERITYSVSVPKNMAFRTAGKTAETCTAPKMPKGTSSVI